MKKLKRNLVIESIISLVIMMSGTWGFFGPFELSFMTPQNHLIISFCGMILGFILFCWGLDSYCGNAYIVDLKAVHSANLAVQYQKIQDKQNELTGAQRQAISWKANFKKLQKRYNEQKKD